ncbi:MAG TPA: hypothetical protein V6C57_25130 [Coleofasciculaceae cyanobacterium]
MTTVPLQRHCPCTLALDFIESPILETHWLTRSGEKADARQPTSGILSLQNDVISGIKPLGLSLWD